MCEFWQYYIDYFSDNLFERVLQLLLSFSYLKELRNTYKLRYEAVHPVSPKICFQLGAQDN